MKAFPEASISSDSTVEDPEEDHMEEASENFDLISDKLT